MMTEQCWRERGGWYRRRTIPPPLPPLMCLSRHHPSLGALELGSDTGGGYMCKQVSQAFSAMPLRNERWSPRLKLSTTTVAPQLLPRIPDNDDKNEDDNIKEVHMYCNFKTILALR
jgi:hypothetical protein